MSLVAGQEPEAAEELSFADLINERLQARAQEAKEEPTPPQSGEEPAAPAPVVEPTPKPGKSWKDMEGEELPEDLPHKFYQKRKLSDLVAGISESERAMHEANRARNEAEGKVAALEVMNQMLKAQASAAPAVPAGPKKTVFEEAGVDLRTDWVMDPDRTKSLLDKERHQELDERETKILGEVRKLIKEKDDKDAEAHLVREMAQTAETSAMQALTDMGIPRDNWIEVLNTIVPVLNDRSGKYFNQGGVLEAKNYKQVVDDNPMLKRAIASYVTPGATTAPPEAANPPGAKAAAVTPKPDRPTYKISDATRDYAISTARNMGIVDPNEIEDYVRETAEAIQRNKARRKG